MPILDPEWVNKELQRYRDLAIRESCFKDLYSNGVLKDMGHRFLNRERKRISGEMRLELLKDRKYCVLREFENDRVVIMLEWDGKVTVGSDAPIEYWDPYKITVRNRLVDEATGEVKYAPDPSSKRFYDEKLAIGEYEAKLVMFTDSYWSTVQGNTADKLLLVEVGNIRAPRPLYLPSEADKDDFAGSW